jgi:hypothetical protein
MFFEIALLPMPQWRLAHPRVPHRGRGRKAHEGGQWQPPRPPGRDDGSCRLQARPPSGRAGRPALGSGGFQERYLARPEGQAGHAQCSSDCWRRAAGATAASTGAGAEVAVRIYLGAGDAVRHSWLRSDDRAGGASSEARLQAASSHAETCLWLCLGQPGTRYQGATSLPRAQKYPAYGAVHRAIAHAV